jgi:hypothetical protein
LLPRKIEERQSPQSALAVINTDLPSDLAESTQGKSQFCVCANVRARDVRQAALAENEIHCLFFIKNI